MANQPLTMQEALDKLEQQSLNDTSTWLFVLLNKGKPDASWWLKLRSLEELTRYLSATNGRYGRAFQNYLDDSQFQPDQMGHGKHIKEMPLAQAAYYNGLNKKISMIDSVMDLASRTAQCMADAISKHGYVYVNSNGGWNNLDIKPDPGDFVHSKNLVWPHFTRADIKISKFPGGEHWYARVGPVEMRNGDEFRFYSREAAQKAAEAYLIEQED